MSSMLLSEGGGSGTSISSYLKATPDEWNLHQATPDEWNLHPYLACPDPEQPNECKHNMLLCGANALL